MKIHDLASQTSLQSFYHMALVRGLGQNPPTAAYVNNVSLTMVVAVDSAIGIMEGKDDDITVLPFASHNRPINAILYNPLFKQVCPCECFRTRKRIPEALPTLLLGLLLSSDFQSTKAFSFRNRSSLNFARRLKIMFSTIAPCRIFKLRPN